MSIQTLRRRWHPPGDGLSDRRRRALCLRLEARGEDWPQISSQTVSAYRMETMFRKNCKNQNEKTLNKCGPCTLRGKSVIINFVRYQEFLQNVTNCHLLTQKNIEKRLLCGLCKESKMLQHTTIWGGIHGKYIFSVNTGFVCMEGLGFIGKF